MQDVIINCSMKIATMVRAYMPVPRPPDILYAPIDLAVEIAEGLHERGHKVDFYAPEGSKLPMPVKTMGVKPLVTNGEQWEKHLATIKPHIHYVPWLWDFKMVREMFERAARGEYDVLFFHHPEVALPFIEQYPDVKVVSTLHDPLYDWYAEIFGMYRSANSQLVSISNHQRVGRNDLPFAATIYNGVDVDQFAFQPLPDDYLLVSGRIVPEKGIAEAVQVARETGENLVIAGLLFPAQQEYFDKQIRPFLNDKIRYVGYVDRDKLVPYYQRAKALLMPISWDEPFGRTITEAMACGTPVIAFNRGSVPEIVAHGKTGFIVDTTQEMADAVKKIKDINRRTCRDHVVKYFSAEKMISDYEKLFTRLCQQAA